MALITKQQFLDFISAYITANGIRANTGGNLNTFLKDLMEFIEVSAGTDGADAPAVKPQYSINGTTLWHDTFVDGVDFYMKLSFDNGVTYTDKMLIIASDGVDGADGVAGSN